MSSNRQACGDTRCAVSTGIHDGLTFGSGRLDKFGYWSRPCRICAEAWDKEDKSETINEIRQRIQANHPDQSAPYIEQLLKNQHAWLFLCGWPYAEDALSSASQSKKSPGNPSMPTVNNTTATKTVKPANHKHNNHKKHVEREVLTLDRWFTRIPDKYRPMVVTHDDLTVSVFNGLENLIAIDYNDLFNLDDYNVIQGGVKNGKHAPRCWTSVLLQPKANFVRLETEKKA